MAAHSSSPITLRPQKLGEWRHQATTGKALGEQELPLGVDFQKHWISVVVDLQVDDAHSNSQLLKHSRDGTAQSRIQVAGLEGYVEVDSPIEVVGLNQDRIGRFAKAMNAQMLPSRNTLLIHCRTQANRLIRIQMPGSNLAGETLALDRPADRLDHHT